MNFNLNQIKEKEELSNRSQQDAIQWMKQHPEIFGPAMSEQAVRQALYQEPEVEAAYEDLSEDLQSEYFNFCMGVRGMKITYDPVFKAVFDPERRPERLEEFLSLCLGENLKILQVLPNESKRLTEEGSLLVMDILVRLESGALVNVEIQRVGYLFPGPRCACYSSDLVMRQYSQVREAKRREGKRFSYQDIKKVYTIVLIQKSTSGVCRVISGGICLPVSTEGVGEYVFRRIADPGRQYGPIYGRNLPGRKQTAKGRIEGAGRKRASVKGAGRRNQAFKGTARPKTGLEADLSS